MITMSKILGGGLPISAILTSAEIAQAFAEPEPVQYNTTFESNPLMAAAALASIETIIKEKHWEQAVELGTYWMNGLRKLQDKCKVIGDFRCKGLMISLRGRCCLSSKSIT